MSGGPDSFGIFLQCLKKPEMLIQKSLKEGHPALQLIGENAKDRSLEKARTVF